MQQKYNILNMTEMETLINKINLKDIDFITIENFKIFG